MSNDFEIGTRIKNRRKQLGLTAEQVATKLNVAPSTIYRYENGEISNMGISSMKMLAEVLDMPVADILGMMNNSSDNMSSLSPAESELIKIFRHLNEEGQDKMIDNGRDLVASGRYIKNNEFDMVGKKEA